MKSILLRVERPPPRVGSLTVLLLAALVGCGHVIGPDSADAAPADVPVDGAGDDAEDTTAPLEAAGPGPVDAAGAAGFSCPVVRSLSDRPDDSPLDQVRVLYALPSDGADDRLDTEGPICTSTAAIERWLATQTGGPRLRLDTANGVLDIGFVRLPDDDAGLRGNGGDTLETGYPYLRDRIERSLARAGLLAPNKMYAVFYGGSSPFSCGGGAWPPVLPGHVAAMYLQGQVAGARACASNPLGASVDRPGYLDYSLLHEIVHTLGFVTTSAPNHHASGHVFDVAVPPAVAARDLMYRARDGSDPPWGTQDPAGLVLDVGRDDYYAHGRPGLPDLAHSSFLEPLPAQAERPPNW
jgi:hypothetical protein